MALVFYVDNANGSDNNGGSSESHTSDVSGVAGVTDNTVVMDLSIDAPDLSGVVAGDVIRINGETVGINGTDLFEILSADDGADTLTLSEKPGTASGLTWAIGGAFATIDRAMNVVVGGDKVWVQSGTDYVDAATPTIDTAGSSGNWVVFEGYTSSTGDGGKATLDGGSTRVNGITGTVTAIFYRFQNLIIENYTGNGFSSNVADDIVFVNCEFNNNGARGVEADNLIVCVNCSATGNSTDGIGCDLGLLCINCTAHNNTNNGLKTDTGGACLYNCIMSSNGASGGSVRSGSVFPSAVLNCTVDGDTKNTSEGLKIPNVVHPVALVNNIVYDCDEGIDCFLGVPAMQIGLNNLVNNNTLDYKDWDPTGTDVTGAPNFTNEAAQDYTLGSGSAAIDAGSDYSGSSSPGMDIGAHQKAGAAGGGLLTHPGMGGGARG